MDTPVIEFINRARYEIGAQIEVNSKWKSQNSTHREVIRSALIRTLRNGGTDLSEIDERDLKDLSKIPRSPKFSVSISHCSVAGGFAVSRDSKTAVGFDIEETKRIEHKTVQRISKQSEVTLVPNSPALWVIKEASFKCVSNSDSDLIETLSGIEVTRARPLTGWNYEGFTPIKFLAHANTGSRQLHLRGFAGVFNDLSIALATTFSST